MFLVLQVRFYLLRAVIYAFVETTDSSYSTAW